MPKPTAASIVQFTQNILTSQMESHWKLQEGGSGKTKHFFLYKSTELNWKYFQRGGCANTNQNLPWWEGGGYGYFLEHLHQCIRTQIDRKSTYKLRLLSWRQLKHQPFSRHFFHYNLLVWFFILQMPLIL